MIISSAVPHMLSSSSSNNISNTGKSNNLNLSAIFRKNTAYGCSSVAKQDLPDFLFLLLILPKNRKYLSIFGEDPKLSKSGFVSDFFFAITYWLYPGPILEVVNEYTLGDLGTPSRHPYASL